MSGDPGAGDGPRTSHLSFLSHKLNRHEKMSALLFHVDLDSFFIKIKTLSEPFTYM